MPSLPHPNTGCQWQPPELVATYSFNSNFFQQNCAFVSTRDDRQAKTHCRFQKTPKETSQGFTLGLSLAEEGALGQPQPRAAPRGQVRPGWALLWHLGAGAGTLKGLTGVLDPGQAGETLGRGGQDSLVASEPRWFCWSNDLRQAITQLAGGNFKPSVVLTRCCKLISYF